jgi:hypothetical protein
VVVLAYTPEPNRIRLLFSPVEKFHSLIL